MHYTVRKVADIYQKQTDELRIEGQFGKLTLKSTATQPWDLTELEDLKVLEFAFTVESHYVYSENTRTYQQSQKKHLYIRIEESPAFYLMV